MRTGAPSLLHLHLLLGLRLFRASVEKQQLIRAIARRFRATQPCGSIIILELQAIGQSLPINVERHCS